MKLEQLYPNFAEFSFEQKELFVRRMREQRESDLTFYVEPSKKRKASRRKKTKEDLPKISEEQKEKFLALGFTPKEISAILKGAKK